MVRKFFLHRSWKSCLPNFSCKCRCCALDFNYPSTFIVSSSSLFSTDYINIIFSLKQKQIQICRKNLKKTFFGYTLNIQFTSTSTSNPKFSLIFHSRPIKIKMVLFFFVPFSSKTSLNLWFLISNQAFSVFMISRSLEACSKSVLTVVSLCSFW